jgi:hypothetical protein
VNRRNRLNKELEEKERMGCTVLNLMNVEVLKARLAELDWMLKDGGNEK